MGRGAWGYTYAKTLSRLGIDFWLAGKDFRKRGKVDGIIVATSPESHYEVAFGFLRDRVPVLIEKPVALSSYDCRSLLTACSGICFTGHTRLYSPAWREFKRPAKHVTATVADWWDWGPHAVAMSLDLGCETPDITVTGERMTFFADGREFKDVDDQPLEVLVKEFCQAIERGKPNNEGLQLGLRVVQFLENHEPR